METNPLEVWVQAIYEKMARDFSFDTHQPAERAEILSQIGPMVVGGALVQAEKLLGKAERERVDEILKETRGTEEERAWEAARYIALKVPSLKGLLESEYLKVRKGALQIGDEARVKEFEAADKSAEAAGDLVELVEDASEAARVDVPGLSAVGVGVDLLYDPARFRRSSGERQARFFRRLAELSVRTLLILWIGLLSFTSCESVDRHYSIVFMSDLIRQGVPGWYQQQSLQEQVTFLTVSGILLVVAAVVISVVFARASLSPSLTPAFDLRVSEEELASTVLKDLLPTMFPPDMYRDRLWDFCKMVYRSVYNSSFSATSEGMKMLDEILESGDEKAAAAFLKSRVRGYRSALRSRARYTCEEAARLMESIH